MKKFLPGNRKKERKPSDDEIQTRKSEDFFPAAWTLAEGFCVCLLFTFFDLPTYFDKMTMIQDSYPFIAIQVNMIGTCF